MLWGAALLPALTSSGLLTCTAKVPGRLAFPASALRHDAVQHCRRISAPVLADAVWFGVSVVMWGPWFPYC